MANMWPAAYRGTGFLRRTSSITCCGTWCATGSFRSAPHSVTFEQNWYLAWLKYVVATGRA